MKKKVNCTLSQVQSKYWRGYNFFPLLPQKFIRTHLRKSILFCFIILFGLTGCKNSIEENTVPESPKHISDDVIVSNSDYGRTRRQNLDYIFNNQTLGETSITMLRSEWNKLCDNYRYFYKNENCVKALSYSYKKDDCSWTLKDVGLRLRGNTSRCSPQGLDNGREQGQRNASWKSSYYDYAEKQNNDYRQANFKVDFEEFLADGENQKMAGCMSGVALKRMDNSCSREIFCFDLFHQYGIWTAPRASHTRLSINIIEDNSDNSITSIDFGVYEMFEEVNKQALKARDKDENTAKNAWKNSKGNLWKGSRILTDTASDLTDSSGIGMGIEKLKIFFDDEEISGQNITIKKEGNRTGYVFDEYSLDLKTNKNDFETAKKEFCNFIWELNELPTPSSDDDTVSTDIIKTFYEKWFDVDFFIKTYAINIICGMDDDYWAKANNYYLYFCDDKNGKRKVYFIPFDFDNSLGQSTKTGGVMQNPLKWGRGENRPLMDKLISVPEYRDKFVSYLKTLTAEDSLWNYKRCSSQFLKWKDMVSPYLNSKDLCFKGGIGANSFSGACTNPSGYSLVDKSNNLYDATRECFKKWLEK